MKKILIFCLLFCASCEGPYNNPGYCQFVLGGIYHLNKQYYAKNHQYIDNESNLGEYNTSKKKLPGEAVYMQIYNYIDKSHYEIYIYLLDFKKNDNYSFYMNEEGCIKSINGIKMKPDDSWETIEKLKNK